MLPKMWIRVSRYWQGETIRKGIQRVKKESICGISESSLKADFMNENRIISQGNLWCCV